MIVRREVSSAEVVEAHIARIRVVNPHINAIVVERFDAALRDAREADAALARGRNYGPLHGVPVTVKECFDIIGAPTTFGTTSRKFHSAKDNDPYVKRLVEVGAIVIGKTNVPQAMIYNETNNAVYGRTNNPWNPKRTPGGSSGGEAAIIAAGGSPIGLGSDVAGSLRYPASHCGIASFKPTSPRMLDDIYSSLPAMQRLPLVSVVGPMAREVDDLAMLMLLLEGVPNRLLPDPEPLGDYTAVDVSTLRVGYFDTDGFFAPAPVMKRAVNDAVESLHAAGATCTPWFPPVLWPMHEAFSRMLAYNKGAVVRDIVGSDRLQIQLALMMFLAGRTRAQLQSLQHTLELVGQHTLARQLNILGFTEADLPHLADTRRDLVNRITTSLDSADGGPFDVIICPATSLPAWRHNDSAWLVAGGAYASVWNMMGYPAGVVPATMVRADEEVGRAPSRDIVERIARKIEQGSTGLPVGVQVVARPWQDHVALAAMKIIQDAAREREGYPATPVDPVGLKQTSDDV
jgi:fatty acid amide hydrolase